MIIPLVVCLDGEGEGPAEGDGKMPPRFLLTGQWGDWKGAHLHHKATPNLPRIRQDFTQIMKAHRSRYPDYGDGRGHWFDHWVVGKHGDMEKV